MDPALEGPATAIAHCAAIAQRIGASAFEALALGYQDLMADPRPRLLPIGNRDAPRLAAFLQELQRELHDWVLLPCADGHQPLTSFADAGLLITRATAPLREVESEAIKRLWRHALVWLVAFADADDVDDDLEDAEAFTRQSFHGLVGGRRTLLGVFPSATTAAQALRLLVGSQVAELPNALLRLRHG